jgi:hypothetical protein
MRRSRFLLTLFFLMVILGSCMTTRSEGSGADEPQETEVQEYQTWLDLRAPLTDKLDLPPLDEVVRRPAADPLWLPTELPFWVWLPEPRDDGILFLGSSYPRSTRKAELEHSIENAARQAAQYAGIAAIVSSYRGKVSGGSSYAEDIKLFYNENLIPGLISEAELRALHQDETGSYLLVRFPSISSVRSPLPEAVLAEGREAPAWIEKPPVLANHYTGIGVSRPRIRFADSISQADTSAVAEILTQLASSVEVTYDVRSGDSSAADFSEENYQYSTAMVRGIQIVARWRSPDGSYFYSLALLPRQ